MSTQYKALRLADELDQYLYSVPAHPLCTDAAAELRRLHADNKLICSALNGWIRENSPGGWIDDLRTQRIALLEALKGLVAWADDLRRDDPVEDLRKARAAIKMVEGEKT